MADTLENAKAQVALKYDPQQAAIERQIQAIKDQTASNEAGINTYGTQGRQAIGNVYDTLNSLLTANRQQSASDLARSVGAVGAGYDTATAYQNAIANEGRARLANLANQVGAGTAGNLQVQTQLEQTLAGLLGQQAQQKAAAMGNLQDWSGRWDQILGQGINIGEQTRATNLSEFEKELLNMLGSNRVAGLEGQNAQYGKMNDILSARGNDLLATYNQLAQQDWENAFRQAQLDQQAAQANASLAMEQARMNLSAQGQAADNAYRNAQLAKEGQLTLKDLIGLANDQRDYTAAQSQQEFDNRLALQQFYASQRGEYVDPNATGNAMLAKMLTDESYTDLYESDQPELQSNFLNQYASQLAGLGFGNNIYDSLLQQARDAAANQSMFDNYNPLPVTSSSSGGGYSGGGSGGGFSLNLGNALQKMVHGFSLGQYR